MSPRAALAPLTLYLVALAVRLVPLLLSPLPYNIDGFAQVHLAQGIAASGHWSLGQDPPNAYNLKMPVLPLLLAAASEVLGLDPIAFVQLLVALVTSTAIPATYALLRRWGTSPGAAVAGGTFLALSGTFVFLTASTMKEALGLALLPGILLLFRGAADARRRGLAILLLALLPLLHNLTAFMALAFVAAQALEGHVAAYRRRALQARRAAADGLLLALLTALAVAYYTAIRMEFFSQLANGEDVALLLSVVFLFSLVAIAQASRPPARPLLPLAAGGLINGKGLALLGILLLVVANGRRSLFAGTATTSPTLLLVALAYLPLGLLGLAGLELARAAGERLRLWAVALILVPLGVMVFALLRGLDPLSFVLLYRSFDFLDFGMALCVGQAAASALRRSPRAGRAIGCLLVAALLLTLPAAFATEETFGVRNTTTPAEFAALGRLARLPPGAGATDQKFADTLAMYWSRPAAPTLPLDLVGGREPNAPYLLLAEDWAARGAQAYPMPRIVVPRDRLAAFALDRDVIYSNSGGLLLLMDP